MTVFFMEEKTITKLAVQKNNTRRVNVFLDEKFAFGVSRMAGRRLQIGQKLSQPEIDQLLSEDEDEVVREKALDLLKLRPLAEKELRKKLLAKGFESERIERVIGQFKESELIDDQKFSALWVENRRAFHPRSQRMIAYELRQKGIAEEIILDSLQNVEDDQTAFDLAFRYSKRLANLDWQTFRKRLGGYLARKGYDFETIDWVTRRIWSETIESEKDR